MKTEGKKKNIQEKMRLIEPENEPFCHILCVPRKYRTQNYFKYKLSKIDKKIENLTEKPIFCCGHAFILLNDIEAIQSISFCFCYF